MSDWFDAEAHADRALELYERGRWAEAESELRKALSLNPDQADWHYNLGLTLEAAGRDVEALASYERTIELLPDLPDPLVAAGVICSRLRRYATAIEWFDRALATDSSCESAYAHKIDALTRSGDHDEAEATFYLAQQALSDPSAQCLAAVAESLIDRGQYGRAGWCLKESLRLEPNMPRLRARLAAVLAATGKPQRALQMYLRDLRDDPGNIDTLLDYGELLIDLGRLPEASEKFRRVLEFEPANVDAHYRLGQVAMFAGRYEHAYIEFELVMKLDGQYPGIRTALAEALLARHEKIEARRCLQEELESRSQRDVADESSADRERLGDLLLAADLAADAAEIFQEAVTNDGESVGRLRKLAVARFRSGNAPGGVAASRRAVRLDPTCVPAMHNLALAALREGQLRVAAGWIARGLRIDRHDDGLRRLRMQHWAAWLRSIVKRRLR